MVINMIKKAFFIIAISLSLANISLANVASRDSYADVLQPLIPAVVNISVSEKAAAASEKVPFSDGSGMEDFQKFFEFFGQMPGMEDDENSNNKKPNSAGSGFIISPEGYIVTNHHVVEKAEKITVTLSNDQKLDAKLIGSDSRTDLALIKVESKAALPFVKFGNSDESRVGDVILTIGNPFGLGSTVTSGIISAQARDIHTNSGNIIDNFIQTDASINRGNSGGPMFNMKGEVIGINFAIFSPTGGSVGVGFAVPSTAAKPIIEQLMKTGKVHHGWLGVAIQSTEDLAEGLGINDGVGALVSSVTSGSPAEKAGIQVGDIILKFDGKEITTNRKLPRIVAETPIGKKVFVELMSKGKPKTISLTVSEIDSKTDVAENIVSKKTIYGMSFSPVTEELRRKFNIRNNVNGVLVSNVERKSLSASYGIKRGDVINAINQQAVNSAEELHNIIEEAKKSKRKAVMMQLYRNGRIIFLNMPIMEK
jgi:serine protease Do